MWRLKARPRFDDWSKATSSTSDLWVPLLTSQEIIEEYDQSEVNTLHDKNLLLLGEDRFLTTLMLRRFPKRKLMFVPGALCHTVAPDSFKVSVECLSSY
jgi:chitin synthase